MGDSRHPTLKARIVVAGLLCALIGTYAPQAATPAVAAPCEIIDMRIGAGSELDWGWNGAGHDQALLEGAATSFAVVRRCSVANTVCAIDTDCPSGEACDLTCDCDSAIDPECEIMGPVGASRCIVATNQACAADTDCPGSQTCEKFFGPPLPLSAEGTPTCVTSYFQDDLVGTVNLQTGSVEASAFLRFRVHLGIQLAKPCPRCGAVAQNPEVGDTFTCDGGPRNGQTCTVDGVSPAFGGTSFDCPPDAVSNVTGAGLAIDLARLSTGAQVRDAVIPCGGSLSALHPDNGGGVCLDTFAACSSNADCLRCSGDPTVVCSGNGDCTGNGTCAAAPEQPIACGVYCHCGFCDSDPDQPCNTDADCDAGETCAQGAGANQQLQGNKCTDLACGLGGFEQCCSNDDPSCVNPTAKDGKCTLQSFRSCNNNVDCSSQSAGTCTLTNRPCFENRIARTGTPSPLGAYCTSDPAVGACTTNSDCNVGACVSYAMEPTATALVCVPATASASINAASGAPGPAAFSFVTELFVDGTGPLCVCGNGNLECVEQCDDGNATNADGCDTNCTATACGNGVLTPTTGEECDDGDLNSGDGCDSDCSITACGNGIQTSQTSEDCDDGNLTDGDGCDSNCTVTECGNGVLTASTGEQCDDGNQSSNDGCSSTCQIEIPTLCDLASACLTLGAAGRSQIEVVDHDDPARDKLKWRWTKGETTDPADVGSPLTTTSYAICLYDSGALTAEYEVPPSGIRWEIGSRSTSYRDKSGSQSGVTSIKIRPDITGRARVEARAGGVNLALPGALTPFQYFQQSPDLNVRLVNSEGHCWETVFPVSSTRKNSATRFQARVP